MDRRDLIRTAGAAAAGLTLLNHVVQAQDTPGAGVTDRASSIRITALKTYWVGPIVYVKIETNHGIAGWGDLKGTDVRVGRELAHSLFELLDGENPTRIEHLWQKMFRAHRDIRGGAIMIHAMAAIDIALWDIAGKLWNTPCTGCLAVRPRSDPRLYAAGPEGARTASTSIRELRPTSTGWWRQSRRLATKWGLLGP
jgi:L-alanine-DL-glutamate epimerase-like enolase superfamily enzyme